MKTLKKLKKILLILIGIELIDRNKILVIVPARGGSKGVPKKNIKLLGSNPLILYTTERARELFDDAQICVSTDDVEIKSVVEKSGLKVPYLRPAILATDTSSSYDVIIHALDFYSKNIFVPEIIILLQPTSPFRTPKDISKALNLYYNECDMVVSVKETKSNPYYNLFEEEEGGWLVKSKPSLYTRRQDCPKVWEYNGAIYVINVKSLKRKKSLNFERIRKIVMDDISSHDIDTMLDWEFAEYVISNSDKY